jgi:hypothetical protein
VKVQLEEDLRNLTEKWTGEKEAIYKSVERVVEKLIYFI